MRFFVLGLTLAVAACSKPEAGPTAASSSAAPALSAVVDQNDCGELACRLYDSPVSAFDAVLDEKPLVLAIGETHALKGKEGVESTTKRFIESLLPRLENRATDLVLELWVPNLECKNKVAKVAKRQKPVTKKQAEGNQNEFMRLGKASEKLGIKPHVLKPACDEYDKILEAGAGDIGQMLEMIARLTARMSKKIVDRNAKSAPDKMLVAYGGAMHNDLVPRPGMGAWSFGPDLAKHTKDRYVELDLIVPEFIGDNESWRSLPWYGHFDPTAHPGKTTVFNPRPGSYVLIFPKGMAAAPPEQ